MAKPSKFSLNDNSSDNVYHSGSMLTFPKIGLEAAIEDEYRRYLALSASYQTVGESLSSRHPPAVSKLGDTDTGETVLEMASIGNLIPGPAYSSNPINK